MCTRVGGSFSRTRCACAGGTVPSCPPTSSAKGTARRGRSRHRLSRSQSAIIASAPATWAGLRIRRAYSARPWLSSVEPVAATRRCTAAPSPARRANSQGTQAWRAISRAIGPNTRPARPSNGSSAALMPTSCAGAIRPSSVARTASAAPAEWPSTSVGGSASASASAASACAMPGNDAPGNGPLKPWPGRSGTTSVACGASRSISARQEWLAAPVPCSSHSTGWPGAPRSTCTCQAQPPASTNRLAPRCGQWAPSRDQSSAPVMGRPLSWPVGQAAPAWPPQREGTHELGSGAAPA